MKTQLTALAIFLGAYGYLSYGPQPEHTYLFGNAESGGRALPTDWLNIIMSLLPAAIPFLIQNFPSIREWLATNQQILETLKAVVQLLLETNPAKRKAIAAKVGVKPPT